MCNFQVNCADSHIRKNNAVSLNKTSAAADLERAKTIYTNGGERWLIWSNPIGWKIGHLLLAKRALSSLATKAFGENSSNNSTCIDDPKLFAHQFQYILSP